jgi:hypothetical protein
MDGASKRQYFFAFVPAVGNGKIESAFGCLALRGMTELRRTRKSL